MYSIHNRYIKLFEDFGEALLKEYSKSEKIIDLTKTLSDKANDLIMKAIYIENIDIVKLKKELFQLEQKYIGIILSRHNKS